MSDQPFRPVIRTQIALEAAWRQLMEPLGFGGTSLWLMLIGPDDRPLPRLTQIEECTGPADPTMVANLADMLAQMLDEAGDGHRWAVLRSRPGRGGVGGLDRAWAAAIYRACAAVSVPLEVVHLATDDTLTPMPMDEVCGYGQAS